jgi:hypothetical protein
LQQQWQQQQRQPLQQQEPSATGSSRSSPVSVLTSSPSSSPAQTLTGWREQPLSGTVPAAAMGVLEDGADSSTYSLYRPVLVDVGRNTAGIRLDDDGDGDDDGESAELLGDIAAAQSPSNSSGQHTSSSQPSSVSFDVPLHADKSLAEADTTECAGPAEVLAGQSTQPTTRRNGSMHQSNSHSNVAPRVALRSPRPSHASMSGLDSSGRVSAELQQSSSGESYNPVHLSNITVINTVSQPYLVAGTHHHTLGMLEWSAQT